MITIISYFNSYSTASAGQDPDRSSAFLNLFKKNSATNRFVGLGLGIDGVGIAQVSWTNGQYILEDVDFAYGRRMDELEQALHKWVNQYDLKNLRTNLVLAADEAILMLTEAPNVDESELQQALRWKLKDRPEISASDSVIDCFSIPGQGERGRQEMAYVVSANEELLKKYVRLIERSQLNLNCIDIKALALRNVAHLLPEDKYGIAFLHLDQDSGLLSISREGNLFFARELEVGYREIGQANNNVSGDEKLKMSTVIQESIENIVLEVQRSLDYYQRYFGQAPIQTLVIAPLPVEFPEVIEYIANELGVSVYELDLHDILNVNNIKLERGLQSKYLPAIGAALRFADTESQVRK